MAGEVQGKTKKKKKVGKRERRKEMGAEGVRLDGSFFFEWSPMAGPDGEERREWRAPVSAAPKEDVMRLHG